VVLTFAVGVLWTSRCAWPDACDPPAVRRPNLSDLMVLYDGVLRRDQLVDAGLSRGDVTAEVFRGRWQDLGPVVVVLHNGPLTPRQQLFAAVQHCGPKAALAGRSAAVAGGLTGWATGKIHVVVPRGVKPRRLPGIELEIHESRRLREGDVHPARLPRQTRMPRSLVDGAGWSTSPRSASGILCAGVQQRLVNPDQLRRELGQAPRIKHRSLLLAVVTDIEGGAQALSEIDFGGLCRRYRLPLSARQTVRLDHRGRRRFLDATLTAADGRVVHVEVDGALHLIVRTYWEDMRRQNELVIADDKVLRFPSYGVRAEPRVVADQLARAFGFAPLLGAAA